MTSRASALISRLALRPHPEGGHYREIYRSPSAVSPHDRRGDRAALTTIYFLLAAGEVSCWHRVASDEVWHYYEGAPLELCIADEMFGEVRTVFVGPVAEDHEPVCVVPAGCWQAARTTGAYTLVGCTVAPGFDFADFVMLHALPEAMTVARTSRHASAVSQFLGP